jgi:hypothetical protein
MAASALAAQVSDRVVEAVSWARAKATVRVVTALRAVVYGLVATVALVTAAVLATAGLVRVWDAYVPVYPTGTRVWLSYVVFGAAFFVPGLWLLGRRQASRRP